MTKIESIQVGCECPSCSYRDELRNITRQLKEKVDEIDELKKQRISVLNYSEEQLQNKDNVVYKEIIEKLKISVILEEKNGVIEQLKKEIIYRDEEINRCLNITTDLKNQMNSYLTLDKTNEKLVAARMALKTEINKIMKARIVLLRIIQKADVEQRMRNLRATK